MEKKKRGRPVGTTRGGRSNRISISMPDDLIAWLKSQPEQSGVVVSKLINAHIARQAKYAERMAEVEREFPEMG